MIFHLARGEPPEGDYVHPSLRTEGFIHCSTAAQLPATVERHYPGVADLVVLSVDPDRLAGELRWEESNGGERFPHVYGPIPAGAIVATTPWTDWEPTHTGSPTDV